MSTPSPPPNTYDLQVEIWALKEELEDAKEIIDTNFTRVASQAAQIHRLRQDIRAKNQVLEEAGKMHAERVGELEAEVSMLRGALRKEGGGIGRGVEGVDWGLRGVEDVVEESPERSDVRISISQREQSAWTERLTRSQQQAATANSQQHTSSSPPQNSSSIKRKRKARIQQDDDGDDLPASYGLSMPTRATHQKIADEQMDKRLAVVLDLPPLRSRARIPAEATAEQHNPAGGRNHPLRSSRKRPKLSTANEQIDIDTATFSPSAPDASAALATRITTASASARPSNIVVLKYRSSGSKRGEEEGETTEEEVMVPRRGLRVKKAARGRDTI